MIQLDLLTIKNTIEHLKQKDFSVAELAGEYRKVIAEKNDDINAYLEVYSDIDEQVVRAQEKVDAGDVGALTGIPIAVKDNILIKGRRASSASKILEPYTAVYDSTVATKCMKEGVVFLGRANMDEFAMGGSTENSAYGVTKNPIDLTRVPGGSSGGSAAAVAMGGALAALGSDTGGSVRQPASFCGVVGLKPTYGSVSRYGLMAMGSSLDVIGPITKTVTDAEILFNTIRGQDTMDSTSVDRTVYPEKATGKKMVIGLPKEVFEAQGLEESTKENLTKALDVFKEKGYEIREVSIPHLLNALAVYYTVMPAEVSSNLARFDGVKYGLKNEGDNLLEDYLRTRGEGFGKEVRRRIMLGTYILSTGYCDAYYNKANIVRRVITEEIKKVFEDVDVLISPTTPGPAFKIGEKMTDPLQMYLADVFTVPASISGIPALSVPYGSVSVDGVDLPLGIQLWSDHGQERHIFSAGKDLLGEQ